MAISRRELLRMLGLAAIAVPAKKYFFFGDGLWRPAPRRFRWKGDLFIKDWGDAVRSANSPGMVALGEIKTIQAIEKRKLEYRLKHGIFV